MSTFSEKNFICPKCNKQFNIGNFVRHRCLIYKEEDINTVYNLYLSGLSIRDIKKKGFNISLIRFALKGRQRTLSEATKLSHKNKPQSYKLSEERKKKISEYRKKYIEKNPEKAPYKLNHSSRKSWPEEKFEKALNQHNVKDWIRRYQNGIYEYDFAFPLKKIDVEIDGRTHNLPKVKEIDKRRDEWSKTQGWTVIRFTAKHVILNVDQCIELLKAYLDDSNFNISDNVTKSFLMLRTVKERKRMQKKNGSITQLVRVADS